MRTTFAVRLKELRKGRNWTQSDLARRLHVAQTTIANYENGSRLPDLEKLTQLAVVFQITMDYLLGKDITVPPADQVSATPADYIDSLMQGRREFSRNIILSLIAQGLDSAKIYSNYLEPALTETGNRWQTGGLEVWQEHLISETVLTHLSLVKGSTRIDTDKPQVIISLLPGSERHGIGLRMVSNLLEERGYTVYYLGDHVPGDNVVAVIQTMKPDAILLSITLAEHVDATGLLIEKIRRKFRKATPQIIVGGQAAQGLKQSQQLAGLYQLADNFHQVEQILTSE